MCAVLLFLAVAGHLPFELQVTDKSDRLKKDNGYVLIPIQYKQWRSVMTRSSTRRYFSWTVQGAVELQLDLVVFLSDVHVPL